MLKRRKISLYKFQQIDEYMSRTDLDEQDKLLFAVCVVYDLTEFELDQMDRKKVLKMISVVNREFYRELNPKPVDKIGRFELNYNPSTYTFGQFISLSAYVSQSYIKNAHKILGVVSGDADETFQRAEYFLNQPMNKVVGSIKRFIERFQSFIHEYKDLFGLDREDGEEVQAAGFQKRWGWIYSATKVAEHNRVTLDEAMGFNVRQAFNDLAYLKAKDRFDAEQIKKS